MPKTQELPEEVQDIIREVSNKIIVIADFTERKKDYAQKIEKYYDYLKQGFEYQELRTCPVHFKFFDRDDATIHSLQLRHFLTNMIFWEPLVRLKLYDRINDSYIVDGTQISSKLIKSYIDNKIIIPFRREVGNEKLNIVIHNMLFNLARIPMDFNIILGLSINIETFIDVAKKSPRFNEILRTKIDDSMQPNEIEDYLQSLVREQINILKEEDNFLRPILKSQTGIKEGQLKEFSVNGGLAPDLDGATIPIPINSNFVVGGLGNITNYYLDALKGRKSIIMNKTVMGRSGHFARMVMLLTSVIKLSEIIDCGTLHAVEMEIKSPTHLGRLKGRYYRQDGNREYKTLRGDETYLIGDRILLRSPAKCAAPDGICQVCYGELYYTNKDIESVGGFAGTEITNPLSQAILSSKHLLTTQSQKIEFTPDFYPYLSINANEVMLNVDNEEVDLNNYSLVLIKDNIQTIDEFDENEYNSYVELFHIRNKKTQELYEIRELTEKEMYITPELKELLAKDHSQKDVYEIDFSRIGDEDRLFAVEISNNELTKPLYSIMHLLNRVDHEGCTTIDEMVQMMLDLMIISGIGADSVHGELMIYPLIRSTGDILERPNFRKYKEASAYQILTVEGALRRHPSVLISLAFQDLGRQLINPLTFRKKGTAFIDPFFKNKP